MQKCILLFLREAMSHAVENVSTGTGKLFFSLPGTVLTFSTIRRMPRQSQRTLFVLRSVGMAQSERKKKSALARESCFLPRRKKMMAFYLSCLTFLWKSDKIQERYLYLLHAVFRVGILRLFPELRQVCSTGTAARAAEFGESGRVQV